MSSALIHGPARPLARAALQNRAPFRHDPLQRLVVDILHRSKRIHATDEKRFRFVDVADAGDHALIEEDIADFLVRLLADASQSLIDIERFAEEIGTVRGNRAEFGDRNVEADRFEVVSGNEQAHVVAPLAPALAGAIQVPTAVHPQMGAQDERARELDDQILARRGDALDSPAAQRRPIVDARQLRQNGLESRNHFAGERLMQRARGAKNRVAFRHFQFIPSAGGGRRERGISGASATPPV